MRYLIFTPFIFLLCLAYSCGSGNQMPQFPPTEVVTLKIEPKTIPLVWEYVGFTKSSHSVEIRARVEGYLEDIAYSEGAIVQKDHLLFQLDSQPYIASLDMAKGDFARAEAILWEAKRAEDRLKPLFEQNAVSKRDYDNAIAKRLTSEADVLSTKAKVHQAELNLGYTTIKSPILGLAGQSSFREGSLITPGPNGLLTTISVIDPIWVTFSVSESDLLKFAEEQAKDQIIVPKDMNFELELVLANGQKFPQKGKVSFTEPFLQQATGTLNVRAVFDNPQGALLPGQFVRIRILGAKRPNAIVIPQRAVLQGRKGMFVYVVQEGKAISKPIVPGDWYGNDWVIKAGLEAGDEVVIDGVNKIEVGSPVKSVQWQPENIQ